MPTPNPATEVTVIGYADAAGTGARLMAAAATYYDSQYELESGQGAGAIHVQGYDQALIQWVRAGTEPGTWAWYVAFSLDGTNWSPEVGTDEVAGAVSHPFLVRDLPLDATRPGGASDTGAPVAVALCNAKWMKLRANRAVGGDETTGLRALVHLSPKR